MFPDLRRAAGALMRHVAGYLDLIEAEATQAARSVRERLVLLLIGLMSALLSVSLAAVWIIVATWDESYRLWIIGGLSALFAVAGVTSLLGGLRGGDGLFVRLRAEWTADRAAFSGVREEHHGRQPG